MKRSTKADQIYMMWMKEVVHAIFEDRLRAKKMLTFLETMDYKEMSLKFWIPLREYEERWRQAFPSKIN